MSARRARPRAEAAALVLLRTLVGWHFLYEGGYKLALPGWSRSGAPLAAWSARGYLEGASGPLAPAFQALAHPALLPWIDLIVPVALVLVGLSLMLGLFTQAGAWGALAMLTLFYLVAIPTAGVPTPFTEGTYLIVSKTLIEWAAVLVLLTCRTGEVAGLDLLRRRRALRTAPAHPLST
jgi:thiosulfate dehydrogenase [quinone] large subunit